VLCPCVVCCTCPRHQYFTLFRLGHKPNATKIFRKITRNRRKPWKPKGLRRQKLFLKVPLFLNGTQPQTNSKIFLSRKPFTINHLGIFQKSFLRKFVLWHLYPSRNSVKYWCRGQAQHNTTDNTTQRTQHNGHSRNQKTQGYGEPNVHNVVRRIGRHGRSGGRRN